MSKSVTDDIRHMAAIWVGRINSQTLSDEELWALERWLNQSPAHRAEFDTLQEVWDLCGSLEDDEELLRYTYPAEPNRKRYYAWAASFAALALTLLFVFLPPASSSPEIVRFTTQIGEQRHVSLPDGSTIQLNTNTSLLVDFSERQRRVLLEKGEAFFSVAKEQERLFSVQTGSQSISVLGTRFNVRQSGNQFTVSVEEGVVAVHRKEEPLRLGTLADASQANQISGQYKLLAGQIMTFADDSYRVATDEHDNLARQLNWREGIVTFEETPLMDVVAELNRYSKQRILIADNGLMQLKVTGVFHLQQLQQVLSGLEATFPLEIRYANDMVFIEKAAQDTKKT